MSDNSEQLARANDIAAQIAIMELLRVLAGEVCYSDDPAEFKRRLQRIENGTVSAILSRQLFPQANAATESYVKEAAAAWVTSALAGVLHPSDRAA